MFKKSRFHQNYRMINMLENKTTEGAKTTIV